MTSSVYARISCLTTISHSLTTVRSHKSLVWIIDILIRKSFEIEKSKGSNGTIGNLKAKAVSLYSCHQLRFLLYLLTYCNMLEPLADQQYGSKIRPNETKKLVELH